MAEQAGVLRKSLYEWRAAFRAHGVAGLNRKRGPKPGGRSSGDRLLADAGPPAAARAPDESTKAATRIAALERLVGRQQADLEQDNAERASFCDCAKPRVPAHANRLDQLWVADITYIRLDAAFVYLAVVVDAFSRKVVGFALDDHLEARLALPALDMAVAARNPPPGLACLRGADFSWRNRGALPGVATPGKASGRDRASLG